MFCSRCETEYEEQRAECPRCGILLTPVPPPGAARCPEDLVPVFETADTTLLPIIKSLLDAAEIPYLVQGDHVMGLLPLGRFGIGVRKGVLGAIVHVPREWAKEARALLESSETQNLPDEND